jgi:hypothetical protein
VSSLIPACIQGGDRGGSEEPIAKHPVLEGLSLPGPVRTRHTSVVLQQRLYNGLSVVIPAKAGIQVERTGFRIESGMTQYVKPFLKHYTSSMSRRAIATHTVRT